MEQRGFLQRDDQTIFCFDSEKSPILSALKEDELIDDLFLKRPLMESISSFLVLLGFSPRIPNRSFFAKNNLKIPPSLNAISDFAL